MRYFGRSDGSPITNGKYWVWDPDTSRGHWIRPNGTGREESGFTLVHMQAYMELPYDPIITSDLLLDEGI
jgi:hypothetical protein